MEVTKITASVTADSTSPWFAGHFPNNPILPGIAQLKMVVDLLNPGGGHFSLTRLSRVKFRKRVSPGEKLDIQITVSNSENHYLFKITSGNEDVCSGKMLFTQTEIANT